MKINFALVGLAAAQSGEGKDYEYEYPAASEDRWEFSNGVTFTDFSGKNTGYLDSANFVKAMKLSCWNSNMIRDMNNDNKFQRYTSGAPTDESAQQGWKYALGDLTTGYNHQYGFESDTHMNDEFSGVNGNRHSDAINVNSNDVNYGQRVGGTTNEFHKWGYNTDGQNRYESIGYATDAIAYSFGHSDNHDNSANRPYSWDASTDNMPADFDGYKDDWRFSLRMGGCLYESTGWTYDATSFAKVGRLTYTGDNSFFADIFANQAGQNSPTAGSYFADVHWVHVFNAHVFPHRPTGYINGDSATNEDSIVSITGIPKNGYDKTQRDIEDFNVVMANPTYEGHGFLNFVATYHDHVDTSLTGNGYAGYRFYSTINGYNNVDAPTGGSEGCAALAGARTDAPGRTDARCGSAIYDNFGDWYLRPPQKYQRSTDAQPYWSYIMPDGFTSSDNLWTPSSGQRDDESTGFRGFAISSFPHNELGQDFRFNIRTLHNMGMGVSKTNQMMANRGVTAGIIDSTQAIWSYYMYAVDTIKIAFPEYVARVNHCHFASHTSHPNCQSGATTSGWQDIIVDGVTMKSYSNPSLSSDTRYTSETNQYGFNKIMGQDNHALATLHYTDGDFTGFDSTLTGGNEGDTFCANNGHDASTIRYSTAHGVSEDGKPVKPCASWCHPGAMRGTSNVAGDDTSRVCGRVLKIDGLLQTYDELHLRQYGTIQEVWVQLMYAYQEAFDQGKVTGSTVTGASGAESPFPNIFFSAPEVVSIKATCPNSNFKCRGYMTDENQPYGGARENANRVYNNNGAHTIGAGEAEMHADSVYPANEDPYVAGK